MAITMGLRARWRRTALVAAVVLSLVLTVGYIAGMTGLIDRNFIYFPEKELSASPENVALAYESVDFETDDGLQLHGWYIPGDRDVTMLWFHGNAGNIAGRLSNLKRVHDELQVNVFLFDYRGYGRSQGQPSEEGLYRDAEAALAYLESRGGLAPERIIYFGRSLGSAVAVELATRQRPYGLILESAFPSVLYLSEHNYPVFPSWLVKQFVQARYDSLDRIAEVDAPLLMLHGDNDHTVPMDAGRALFDVAKEPKSFHVVHGAGHNDMPIVGGSDYFDRLRSFLDEL